MRFIIKLQIPGYLFERCLTILALDIDIIVIDVLNASDSLNGVKDIILLSLDRLWVQHPIQIIWVLLLVIRGVVEAVVFVQVGCLFNVYFLVVVTLVLEHVQRFYIGHN